MRTSYNIVLIAITILSLMIASMVMISDSFALNSASKKLNDRANALDKEAEQAQRNDNDAKAFAKSLTVEKLREKA